MKKPKRFLVNGRIVKKLIVGNTCLYVGDDNYGQSLIWLNRIINSEKDDLREDIHGFARILQLICHYELGHVDVIEYYVRSTYRFLLKTENLQLFQKYIQISNL